MPALHKTPLVITWATNTPCIFCLREVDNNRCGNAVIADVINQSRFVAIQNSVSYGQTHKYHKYV